MFTYQWKGEQLAANLQTKLYCEIISYNFVSITCIPVCDFFLCKTDFFCDCFHDFFVWLELSTPKATHRQSVTCDVCVSAFSSGCVDSEGWIRRRGKWMLHRGSPDQVSDSRGQVPSYHLVQVVLLSDLTGQHHCHTWAVVWFWLIVLTYSKFVRVSVCSKVIPDYWSWLISLTDTRFIRCSVSSKVTPV